MLRPEESARETHSSIEDVAADKERAAGEEEEEEEGERLWIMGMGL